ncbi:MAG: HEPN domain-containing protein [Actinobacteria bacterium]|nr:HEPN domain-containing protein [Actinomycetota bacterium]
MLLRKADADLAAARVLAADPDPHDDAVGFHAQQAVEKALKAALASLEVETPRTHDLTFLVEPLGMHGVEVPAGLSESEWLSPWAVTTRYDDLEETLDRAAAIGAASDAIAWARARLDALA